MPDDLDEAIDRLRRLNQPVPRPRRLPMDSEVRSAEQRLGLTFHEDFRRYLLRASDVVFGTLEPVTLGGGHTDFDSVLARAREAGVASELTPVCEDNGDFYNIAPTGEVVYWSHNGTTDERWPSLAAWITDVWIGSH